MQNLSLFFFRLAPTALNNEYIRQAFTHYKERLAEGAFQAENQQRMKQAEDRAILKMESMKVTHTKHLFIRYVKGYGKVELVIICETTFYKQHDLTI